MSLMSASSEASRWRGYEYFKAKKVFDIHEIGDGRYSALVSGTESIPYSVTIDLNHVRQSACTCPHAAGRRVICKHMIAVFFTVFPMAAAQYYSDVLQAEEEWEDYQEELSEKLVKFVHSLKKAEAQELLLELLDTGPEWQWERFIRDHIE